MGFARRAGSGNWRSKMIQRRLAERKAHESKGVPVPGTGQWKQHRRRSGSNRAGTISDVNKEWGSTDRKNEDRDRNVNNRARRENVNERLGDVFEDEYDLPVDLFPTHPDGLDFVADEEDLAGNPHVLFNGRYVPDEDDWGNEWWTDDYYAGTATEEA